MDIVESQALMEDNAALLPQRGGRTREHRSVNQRILIRSQQMSLRSFRMTMVKVASLCLRAMLEDRAETIT